MEAFVGAVAEMCEFSGGPLIEPEPRDHGIGGWADNSIASLAKDPAVDASVIVGANPIAAHTAHAIITLQAIGGTVYFAMTRGRRSNTAYVATSQTGAAHVAGFPGEAEPRPSHGKPSASKNPGPGKSAPQTPTICAAGNYETGSAWRC
ncbi:MAG: hypothetical protein LBG60_05550 [Bifidobacteriaceae bacterium]|nr:hypothetical protein [Bifidobacteriaceae bacterium]